MGDSSRRVEHLERELAELRARVAEHERSARGAGSDGASDQTMSPETHFARRIAHELNNPIAFVLPNLRELEKTWQRVAELLALYERGAGPKRIAAFRQLHRLDQRLVDVPQMISDCVEGAERIRATARGLIGSPGADPIASSSSSSPARRGRVLVVDDEPAILKTAERMLRHHHQVVTAASGTEALERLEADADFDVVLCDLMMPDMDGLELYERIAADQPDLARRFVFLTGGAYTDRAVQFAEQVPNLTLEKPLGTDELLAVVAERLAMKQP